MKTTLILATLLLLAVDAANHKENDVVYCHHTRLNHDSKLSPIQCVDLCKQKAAACATPTTQSKSNPKAGGKLVNIACFNQKYKELHENCIFTFGKNVDPNMIVSSGLVAVRARTDKTVKFSRISKPTVFAQILSDEAQPRYGRVKIQNLHETSFTLSVEPQDISETRNGDNTEPIYYVAWFVLGEDTKLKQFGAYHVHLQVLNFEEIETRTLTIEADDNKDSIWSDNIALFVQELTPNITTSVILSVQKDRIIVEVTPKAVANAAKPGEKSKDNAVALLLVDMEYFKKQETVTFGTVPVSSPAIHPKKDSFHLETHDLENTLVFFTPYYNRNRAAVPKATCWSNITSATEWNFACKAEPISLVQFEYEGTPNVAFLAVHAITVDSGEALNEFRYGSCNSAYSKNSKEIHKSPKNRIMKQDMECKRLCTTLRNRCKGDLNCVQSYMGRECIMGGLASEQKKKEERKHMFADAVQLLNYELKGSVCAGMYDAMTIEQVHEQRVFWIGEAQRICEEIENSNDILVVIDMHLSFNLCDGIKEGTSVIWKSLESMRDHYTKDAKPVPVETIFDKKHVYGLCIYNGHVIMQNYADTLPIPEEIGDEPESVDCIESEWAEWSPCSAECMPANGRVVKRRFRYVIRPRSGDGRQCVTEEVKECTNYEIPNCRDICQLTEWGEWSSCSNNTKQRERFIKIYSRRCDDVQLTEIQGCMSKDQVISTWDEEEDDFYGQDYDTQALGGDLGDDMDLEHGYGFLETQNTVKVGDEQQSTDEPLDSTNDRSEENFKRRKRRRSGKGKPIDGTSFFETQGPQESEHCLLWSEWSGCSSACDDEEGHEYKLSSACDPHSIYDLADETESRKCLEQEKCGLVDRINCDTVKSAFFSEVEDAECRRECSRLVSLCRDEKETSNMSCFARLKADSLESGGFFFKCIFPEEEERTIQLMHTLFRNKCFLSRAAYSVKDNSWVNDKNQSCHCSIPGSVPCTAKEIHYTRGEVFRDLIESGFCPSLNYKQSFFNISKENATPDSLTYVSLADNKRLHCPLEVNETFTYTQFKTGELENFCRHGPIYAALRPTVENPVKQYPHNYDCATAAAAGKDASDLECMGLCRTMRTRCASSHESFLRCVKQRLTGELPYESHLFNKYGCRLPSTLDATFDVDYYRVYVSTFDTEQIDKKACAILTQNAIMQCEANELLKNHNSMTWCMASLLGEVEPTTTATPRIPIEPMPDTAERFKEKCKFVPSRKAGSGYVMCRFPTEKESYANWSEWSECTADCNDFESVATRYRTRKVAKDAENSFFHVGEGTLQFELCLHLGGCEKGRWVDSLSETDETIHILDYEAHKGENDDRANNWLEETYRQHPELRNAAVEDATCHIYKSQKIMTSKGVTCGCPRGQKSCSFATAMSNPMWMVGMENFCRTRPLASIVFEGELSYYQYNCKIGMLLRHTRDSETLECDYFDNNEYVACQESETQPLTLRSKHFTLMGVCLGIVFCAYSAMRHVIKMRRRRSSQHKKSE
ncbi:uncharacterized protein BXIN_1702 [Babesia sp. Xinjiang]|uniref:uncharacterized protein n=1 Tax=Babesia sp. Xinjiang TaxID=462227 RepID=UPI000A221484|nr:uncharacterized protein BXIN_1720 [Babesia sp. Xinjiang]XP_028871362.1 uncharacterized protein BXIN_1702 [Babesia sp. Xinjiang]ORM40869.1 hypothetical protein BXIN_1720 [Babesia sp. Xinjiang]ORM40906.1 hypothetical protein BXIN_1702 [Babesia sp. Xinjiang]